MSYQPISHEAIHILWLEIPWVRCTFIADRWKKRFLLFLNQKAIYSEMVVKISEKKRETKIENSWINWKYKEALWDRFINSGLLMTLNDAKKKKKKKNLGYVTYKALSVYWYQRGWLTLIFQQTGIIE